MGMIDCYYVERNLGAKFNNKKPQKELARTLLAEKAFCGGGCLMVKKDSMTEQDLLELGKEYGARPSEYEDKDMGIFRIRKLTPRECWRLMGVKDEDFDKVAKNQSNSSLYHLAGDSIVTTVLMAIFKEML